MYSDYWRFLNIWVLLSRTRNLLVIIHHHKHIWWLDGRIRSHYRAHTGDWDQSSPAVYCSRGINRRLWCDAIAQELALVFHSHAGGATGRPTLVHKQLRDSTDEWCTKSHFLPVVPNQLLWDIIFVVNWIPSYWDQRSTSAHKLKKPRNILAIIHHHKHTWLLNGRIRSYHKARTRYWDQSSPVGYCSRGINHRLRWNTIAQVVFLLIAGAGAGHSGPNHQRPLVCT
jgi:hypothetical protein